MTPPPHGAVQGIRHFARNPDRESTVNYRGILGICRHLEQEPTLESATAADRVRVVLTDVGHAKAENLAEPLAARRVAVVIMRPFVWRPGADLPRG